MNGHLCELGKLFLEKNGNLKTYTYPSLENLAEYKKNIIPLFADEKEFKEFASNIFQHTDLKDVYDKAVEPKIFKMKYSDHSIEWEEW